MRNLISIVILISTISCGKEVMITQPVKEEVTVYYEVKKAYYYCRSENYEDTEIELIGVPDKASNISVQLYKQESIVNCLRNENYGLSSQYSMFCSDGCRGRFTVTYAIEIIK